MGGFHKQLPHEEFHFILFYNFPFKHVFALIEWLSQLVFLAFYVILYTVKYATWQYKITRIRFMKVHAWISFIRAKYTDLSPRQKPIAILLIILFSVLSMIFLLKFFLAIVHGKKHATPTAIVIRLNNKIIIPKDSPLRSQMTVKTVHATTSPHIVSFPGIVEANPSRTINVLPPFPGRLIALKAKLGDYVKQHQVLAVIRSPGLAQAYSDRDKAISILKLTKEALIRARRVNSAGANSIKDIELAQSNYVQALAEFKRTKATLKAVGKNSFSLLRIRAPLNGSVTALHYGIGSYINDTTNPLLTISNIKSVWVTANIPENFTGLIVKDLPVEVSLPAYPLQVLHGKIAFVSTFLEPDTRRNKTRINFPNPNGKLQPNMFATVNIAIPQPNEVTIPISAILMNSDTTCVYVEITPWTFVRREIELGKEDDKNVRVISGLNSGDRVVTSGGVLVND